MTGKELSPTTYRLGLFPDAAVFTLLFGQLKNDIDYREFFMDGAYILSLVANLPT